MTTPTLLAWHGRPELKAEVVARLKAHREADEFIQGNYQLIDPDAPSGYRGCAIGCTLPSLGPLGSASGCHMEVESRYGIPSVIAYDIDDIFEALAIEDAGKFAVEVIEAIPVGADLSGVVEQSHVSHYIDAGPERGAELLIADLAAAAPIPAGSLR